MATEKLYLERENTIDLILKADDVPIGTSAITKINAVFDTVTISSTDKAAGEIKWDQGGYETGEIRLDCGGNAELKTQGGGTWDVPIIIFDPSNPTGIDWGIIRVEVIAKRGS